MAMRNKPMRFRAIRPTTENLESRNLLSGIVSGINSEGDAWTLKLIGPGTIHVIKQPDASGNPTALTSPSEIATITVAGTDPLSTRLVGTVTPSGKGDGRVFFQNFTELANVRDSGAGGNGMLSIDMPGFWLGLTAAAAPTSTSGTEPSMSIPDGVDTLRFGGVDTTAFFGTDPTKTLAANGQSNQFHVTIGTPLYSGVRIIIGTSITSAYTQGGTTYQNGVTFNVAGRLGIFQANQIDGNNLLPPAAFSTTGGTIVQSNTDTATAIIGQLGTVRVGANATNFFVGTSGLIHELFIGGETSNVSLIAPSGSKDLYFGKGFDTSNILTNTVSSLQANRGAINSTLISDRQIGNVQLGGDVTGTTIESGYDQGLSSFYSNLLSGTATTPPTPTPQAGGAIRATIAGNVTNSVFAASYSPDSSGVFGNSNGFALPLGKIVARVEGTISNTTLTPANPTNAFYAQRLKITNGAVVPPNVPEAPYPGPLTPTKLPGIPHPYVNSKSGNS